jgi:hypothetical protein
MKQSHAATTDIISASTERTFFTATLAPHCVRCSAGETAKNAKKYFKIWKVCVKNLEDFLPVS